MATLLPTSNLSLSGSLRDLIGISNQEHLVFADQNTTLNEACELLKKHHISSIPIFDSKKHAYVGLVDFTDICLLVVFSYSQKLQEGKLHQINFEDVKLVDLLPLADEGSLAWTFAADGNVEDTMEAFSKGVHRAIVPIKEGSSTKYHIVSQRDAVKFLLEQHMFDDVFNSKLSELPRLFAFQNELVTIDEASPAIDAFKKIGREHFGAVPVVDDNGQVFASLCASDLTGTDLTLLHTLLLPTNAFLKAAHGNNIPKPLTAFSDDTLRDVVQRILEADEHRVWLLNGQGKLNGVLTLSDICKVFVPRM